jgi:hypothetical protein
MEKYSVIISALQISALAVQIYFLVKMILQERKARREREIQKAEFLKYLEDRRMEMRTFFAEKLKTASRTVEDFYKTRDN